MARDDETIATLKRELGARVAERVRGWNGDDIGSVLGTDRSRIADLRNGRLARFSLETLIRFLVRGGYTWSYAPSCAAPSSRQVRAAESRPGVRRVSRGNAACSTGSIALVARRTLGGSKRDLASLEAGT